MGSPLQVLRAWNDIAEYGGLLDSVRRGFTEVELSGVPPPAAVALGLSLREDLGRPLVLLAPDPSAAQSLAEAAQAWLGPDGPVFAFPAREFLPYAVVAQSPEIHAPRLRTLAELVRRAPGAAPAILVLPVAALRRQLPPPEVFAGAIVGIDAGQRAEPGGLAERLVRAGYRRESVVEGPGTFAVRGGILDVFTLVSDDPWRIEFDDDRVASIRSFSAETQRSAETVQRILLPPAREVPAPEGRELEAALQRVRRSLADMEGRLGDGGGEGAEEARGRLADQVGADLEALAAGQGSAGLWENYLPFAWEPASVLRYAASGGGRAPVCLFVDAGLGAEAVLELSRQDEARLAAFLGDGRILPEQSAAFALPRDWRSDFRGPVLYSSALGRTAAGQVAPERVTIPARTAPPFAGQWTLVLDEVRRWARSGYRVLCWVGTEERAGAIAREFRDAGLVATQGWENTPRPGQVATVVGHLPGGFEVPGLALAVLTEQELFGRRPRTARVRRAAPGARLQSYEDLQVGDYVVHATHGIGQYLGTAALKVQGKQRDYLVLRYEGTDRLYVPTEQVGLVSKYVGGESRQPRVSRLGGGDWNRAKQRVKESVRAMAEELIALYAARQTLRGHAFPPDTPWQAEFEAAFPFDETPDQLTAIREIKADMERPVPMDRLLCGDVGYGKTEVAMRAAFKAVMDGRQVAVLVPTTILAEQHHLTFTERFRGFPLTIRMLSRFRSKREQDETVTGLRRGTVDIVIGTHRLLGDDVGFKNLGLLVVDEEHRFGVAHKERLKQLRQTVDVLAMTATPIPRTLHMAMAGLRDMSAITTPPENRYPVETVVVEWSPALVREAVSREVARRGQVYYLHNRVQSITEALERLRDLAPGADVVVAHGQMPEDELEAVMTRFWRGEHQVLLSTTIIESGLDIPNANTLVVEDADKLGLAQLYQIRGRVGRSSRVAYAYFTYRRERALTEVAERRLQAIREFTELGSGFKIALRDLEIRGAGNILGPEQHGFVAAVGFDLYAQLLEDAVRDLRGEREAPLTRTTVELRVDAFIADEYIAEPRVKLEFYKKIHSAATPAEVDGVDEELRDRFGPYPAGVGNLLRLARVRVLAQSVGLLGVVQEGRTVTLSFPNYATGLLSGLNDLPARMSRRLRLLASPKPVATLALDALDDATVLGSVDACLQALAAHPEVRAWRRSMAAQGDGAEGPAVAASDAARADGEVVARVARAAAGAPLPPEGRAGRAAGPSAPVGAKATHDRSDGRGAESSPAGRPTGGGAWSEGWAAGDADRLARLHGLRRVAGIAPGAAPEARGARRAGPDGPDPLAEGSPVSRAGGGRASGAPRRSGPLRPQAPRGLVLPGPERARDAPRRGGGT